MTEPGSLPSGNTLDDPRPSRRPPRWLWSGLAVLACLILAVQTTELLGEPAIANVASWLLGLIGLATAAVWLVFLSGYRRGTRVTCLVVLLASTALGVGLFRVERITGELVPTFAFRFSPKPDQRMAKPEIKPRAPSQTPIDLRASAAGDFPQFLGPNRNATVEGVDLARDWSANGARLIWKRPIGAGWSAFSVVNGHAVTMEQRGHMEMVACYRVATGEPEWAHQTRTRYESISGGVGPRCTPTIDEGMVYALGAKGHLVCLDGATGECRWQKNLPQEFGLSGEEEESILPWGRSNSPLVLDDLVIVPAGGPKAGRKLSLVAYRKRTGEQAWAGGSCQISYSSPLVAILAGVRQVVIVNEESLSGHDPKTGKTLWESPWPAHSNANPNISQPVVVGPDRLLVSKGYGQGAALLRIAANRDGRLAAEVVWRNPAVLKTKFTSAVLRDGHAYGLSDGVLECVDLSDGRRVWKEGRYRHGQILLVGSLLIVMTESGEIVIVEPTPRTANRVVGRFQALEGMSWNNLALSGRHLLVRNAEEAACYELPLEK